MAVTAGCDVVSPAGAAVIGIVAGLLLPVSVGFFDNVLKIDDPVGAISVHGVCGAAGTLLTGLLSTSDGLFYGHGASFFLTQCIGVGATALWAAVMITLVFLIIKHTIGLRVSAEEELKGLDITEHGLPSAYGGFAFVYDDTPDEAALSAAPAAPEETAVPVEQAVPVETVPSPVKAASPGGMKITRVDILCKMERFDALKRAMFDIGITGMTATNVMGCGEQPGQDGRVLPGRQGGGHHAAQHPGVHRGVQGPCVSGGGDPPSGSSTPAASATERSSSAMWKTSSKSAPAKRATTPSRTPSDIHTSSSPMDGRGRMIRPVPSAFRTFPHKAIAAGKPVESNLPGGNDMEYLNAFLCGGILCAVGQILIDRTQLSPRPAF